jgi:hypothetical protein
MWSSESPQKQKASIVLTMLAFVKLSSLAKRLSPLSINTQSKTTGKRSRNAQFPGP